MQIKEPLNNLIESIKESDIYLTYKHILSQVEENVEINGLVNDIKRLQQRLVKEENKNSSKVNNLEKELEKKKKN